MSAAPAGAEWCYEFGKWYINIIVTVSGALDEDKPDLEDEEEEIFPAIDLAKTLGPDGISAVARKSFLHCQVEYNPSHRG